MIKKKNNKSNLEKKRILFFEMGMMISLAILLVAFESGTAVVEVNKEWCNILNDTDDSFIMPATIRKPLKKAPPAPPVVIKIIDDIEDFEEDAFIFTPMVDVNEGVYIPEFETEPEIVEDLPLPIAEKMPTYHGNNTSFFQKHLQKLVRYPVEAENAGIDGKVYLQFVIDENGKIIREQIIKSPHPSLSEAVLTALKKTDTWKPGEQRGRKVKVSFTIPISFKLN